MSSSLCRLFRRTAPSHRPAQPPRPAGYRPALESLDSRILLSGGLTTPTLSASAATAPAEVRTVAEAPAAVAGPGASQSLSLAGSSVSSKNFSEILSPIIPMIALSDGHTTGAIIWGRDAAGNLVVDDPVAVALRESPALTYRFAFEPDHPYQGFGYLYEAVFTRSDGYQFRAASGFIGGTYGELSLPLPPAVGQYTLSLRFTSGGVEEVKTHTVYVLLKSPLGTVTRSELAIGFAARWATGRSTGEGVVAKLNQSIYRNPLGWKYGEGGAKAPEDFLTGAVHEGDCNNLAEMLSFLAAVHGIRVDLALIGGTFLVPGDHPPLSGVDPSNRTPNALNVSTGVRDAWYNGDHRLVVFKGKYFDPTHGFTGDYNPDDAGSLERSYGENLLGYIGDRVPNTPDSNYIMKDDRVVGIYYSGTESYQMFV